MVWINLEDTVQVILFEQVEGVLVGGGGGRGRGPGARDAGRGEGHPGGGLGPPPLLLTDGEAQHGPGPVEVLL